MNSYSLAADTHRWWWRPAAAGAVCTAAVTAIFVVPATGYVAPAEPPPSTIGGAGVSGSTTVVERPCYLARPDWGTVAGWEHPVCTTRLTAPAMQPQRPSNRPAPDFLP